MKKSYNSTGLIMGIWLIAIFLILGIALRIQWYHAPTNDTTKADTTKVVSARIVELHQHGYTVEYNGMQYNITADVSKITLSDVVKIMIDTMGTETPFDDVLMYPVEN